MFTTTPLKKWLPVRADFPHVKKTRKRKRKKKEKEKGKKKEKEKGKKIEKEKGKKRKRKKTVNLDVHYHAT